MKSLSHTGYGEPGGTLQPKIPRNTFPDNWKGVKVWFNLGSRCCFWWIFRSRYVKYEQLNRRQRRKRFGRDQEKEDTGKKRHLIDVNIQGVDVWFSLGSRRCFWWVFRSRYVKCEQLNRCQRRKRFGDGTKRKKTLTKKAPIWRYKWSRYDHARCGTVGPRFTDTHLIRTPRLYGKFFLSLALSFSLNSTRLMRIPC